MDDLPKKPASKRNQYLKLKELIQISITIIIAHITFGTPKRTIRTFKKTLEELYFDKYNKASDLSLWQRKTKVKTIPKTKIFSIRREIVCLYYK